MERIYLDRYRLGDLLDLRRHMDHAERYLYVRRWVYGKVVDFGCGIGYGTNLLSKNPDVEVIHGYDLKDVIDTEQWDGPKIIFSTGKLEALKVFAQEGIDVLVALELFEHLDPPQQWEPLVKMINPKVILLSFPDKPSIKYNPHHVADYRRQDIVDYTPGYVPVRQMRLKDVTIMMFMKSPEGMPPEMYHNFLDVWD